MTSKSLKLIISLILSCFLSNQYLLASEINNKILTGNVTTNTSKSPEIVIFIPEDTSLTLEDMDKQEIQGLLNKVDELKISENQKPKDTKTRFTRSSALMFLGGMSVTGSIERSMRDDHARGRLWENFTSPGKMVREGWLEDNNEFVVNYVGHPLQWFLLANYLKAAGATDKEAIIISQIVNLSWEFVVEGCYVPPSPKDLATNTLGSLTGVYLYNTILNKPMNATYNKLSYIGDKYNITLLPQIRYNSDSRGVIVGALIKIKK